MLKISRLGAIAAALAIVAVGVVIGTAMADRSPTAPPIVYSGQILNAAGGPVTDGMYTVRLSLWSTPTGTSGMLCNNLDLSVQVTSGHFSVPLVVPACENAFETAEEVYVQLVVSGGSLPTPTTIERANARVGAVPFAVRAERSNPSLYCGSTAPTTGALASGSESGWPAARALCSAAVGCAGSPTAHMCSTSEIALGLQMGVRPPAPGGWVSGPYSFNPASSDNQDDCLGWTTAAATSRLGNHFSFDGAAGAAYADAFRCNMAAPILCCD
jgi:hypothetical protein